MWDYLTYIDLLKARILFNLCLKQEPYWEGPLDWGDADWLREEAPE